MPEIADMFRRHHLSIFRYLKRMTGSEEQAEDLTQEVFLRAVRSLPSDPDLQERAWLFRAARNLLLNLKRDESRRPLPARLQEVPPVAPTLDAALDLESALARLQESDRDVFLLRELGGLGYEDISSICDLTPDAVRSRIHRARSELRAGLAEGIRHIPRRPIMEV